MNKDTTNTQPKDSKQPNLGDMLGAILALGAVHDHIGDMISDEFPEGMLFQVSGNKACRDRSFIGDVFQVKLSTPLGVWAKRVYQRHNIGNDDKLVYLQFDEHDFVEISRSDFKVITGQEAPKPSRIDPIIERNLTPSTKYPGKFSKIEVTVNGKVVKTWKLDHKGIGYEEIDIASKLLYTKLCEAFDLTPKA